MFGFLGHPALTAEEGGHASNYGFEDQQAALRWVRRNIVAFGGDPRRVTELSMDLARYTRTYAYEFDHRTGPGLAPIPGYVWGAGHAAELAYLWPSFDNGIPIAPTFNAAERQLAHDMVAYWGAVVRKGRPTVQGLTFWPPYNRAARVLSLRAGGQSTVISDATYVAEHQCRFWDSLPH